MLCLLAFVLLLTACKGGPDSGPSSLPESGASSEYAPPGPSSVESEASSPPEPGVSSLPEPGVSSPPAEDALSYEEYFSELRLLTDQITSFDLARGILSWSDGTVLFYLDGDTVRRKYLPDGTVDDVFKVKNEFNKNGWFWVASNQVINWIEFPPEMEQPPADKKWNSAEEWMGSPYLQSDYIDGAVHCSYNTVTGEYTAFGPGCYIDKYYQTDAPYPKTDCIPSPGSGEEPLSYEEYFSIDRPVGTKIHYVYNPKTGRSDWSDGTLRFFLENGMVRREYLPDGTIDDIYKVQNDMNPDGRFLILSSCRIRWTEYTANGPVDRYYNALTKSFSNRANQAGVLNDYYTDTNSDKTVTRIYGPDGKIKKP